jgi:hypothetical protein
MVLYLQSCNSKVFAISRNNIQNTTVS